jgi:hypothetical protein
MSKMRGFPVAGLDGIGGGGKGKEDAVDREDRHLTSSYVLWYNGVTSGAQALSRVYRSYHHHNCSAFNALRGGVAAIRRIGGSMPSALLAARFLFLFRLGGAR